MTGLCEGRIVVVTGAGRGIGREHALEFARQGADVVVNDLGAEVDGSGSSAGPAEQVAAEIRALGRRAVVNGDDVSEEAGAERLIATAVTELGGLDVLVNNAGILRDRMLVNMSFAEWDDVVRVHLRGTFAPSHFAAQHWRDRAKAGDELEARIINTSSSSGIYGNAGQTNYGAAKAGIASFTIIAAMELERYGVTVNAIAPGAATRMTIPLRQARGRLVTGGGVRCLCSGQHRPTRGLARERGLPRHHGPGVQRPRRSHQRGRGLGPRTVHRPGPTMGPGRAGRDHPGVGGRR